MSEQDEINGTCYEYREFSGRKTGAWWHHPDCDHVTEAEDESPAPLPVEPAPLNPRRAGRGYTW